MNSSRTVEVLAQIIREVDGSHTLGAAELAERILAGLLDADRVVVGPLPDPVPMRVAAINLHPEYDAPEDVHGPTIDVRFDLEMPRPGKLFNRRELAAALLAAEAAGGGES